ncbi:MAG: hypothetical protein M1818_000829 [Claussenomyces sp. TS43310]|nr:MAG: hypothetical protein M1818_000829 [Claussenomyces sp. TS43310]
MPSVDRDSSRDDEGRLRHQPSASSDHGRAIVPMWDSSDPDRAPPPLPLNPASSPSVTSRPNTSVAIQSAHAALTEKARESAYMTNPLPERKRNDASPERLLIKGAAHKRMQSLQTGHVRDLSNILENNHFSTSPTKSPDKTTFHPSTPTASNEFLLEGRSPEKEPSRSDSPSPTSAPTGRDTPIARASPKKAQQSILGENIPPQSATMLALHSMSVKDAEAPLSNVTNGSTALIRTPQTFDAISNQILSLTSICTGLQREMANLSRRSRDNATDLVSLKAATNARDEDIRKSLRDLVNNLSEPNSRSASMLSGAAPFLLEDKPHTPNTRVLKTISLPRIPSPNSFSASLDRESTMSPTPYHTDGAASIALLEKILRDMGTKEGQELLVGRLTAVADRLTHDGVSTAKKLEDLVQFIKDNTGTRALVTQSGKHNANGKSRNLSFGEAPHLELDFDDPRSSGPMVNRVHNLLGTTTEKENRGPPTSSRASELINEDLLKIIRSVKDSVAQGGGLTAEVKALVRELRGEVLGMGRELGRKLEQSNNEETSNDLCAESARIAMIVEDAQKELKQQIDRVMHESRHQSSAVLAQRSTVDGQEMYNAVKSALGDYQASQLTRQHPDLEKGDIIDAVREAWENYKPDIELQHFGLERGELLTCLREGLQEYAPRHTRHEVGATREEVFTAVVEGLKHFSPPQVQTEASLSREDILIAVRDCLEEFEFPSAPPIAPATVEITRDDMLDAVKEGLNTFDFPNNDLAISRGVSEGLSREDVFDTVKTGLEDLPSMFSDHSGQISERLQEVIETMRTEFQAVSDEAKENVAAHGRDTEQLLDATKDGFERLRSDIESYVDRAADITGKDEILDSMREIFDTLRSDIGNLSAREVEGSEETVRGELEHLRETIASSVVRAGASVDKDEIIDAFREGLENLRADIDRPIDVRSGASVDKDDIIDAFTEGLERLRAHIDQAGDNREGALVDKDEIIDAFREGIQSLRGDIDRPRDSGESILSGTGEILDALHDGLTSLRTEVEKIGDKPVDMTVNYEILDTLKSGLEGIRADMDRLRETSEEDGQIAAITAGAVVTAEGAAEHLKRNDIENLEVLITQLRIKVEALEAMPAPPPPPESEPNILVREDLASIEEAVRNLQAIVSETSGQTRSVDESSVRKEDVEAIETLLRNTKAKIDEMDPEQIVKKDHLDSVELVVRETHESVNEILTQQSETCKREDISLIESLVKEVIVGLGEVKDRAAQEADDDQKVTKVDVQAVEVLCQDVKAQIEQMTQTDLARLASKDDIKDLEEIVKEFNGRIEKHAEANAQAFEERQAETVGVGERVTEVKTFLEEMKDAVKEKLDEGANGVEALGQVLSNLGETVGENASGNKEILEVLKVEFEKSNAGVVGVKLESDERFEKTWGKFEEKFNELMTKYDDAQLAAEAKVAAGDEKMAATEAAMQTTKLVAEDLKLIGDTLGATVTESAEKMDEASKTVFQRVEDTFTRVEETHADAKAEHQLTRDQVSKTLSTVECMDGRIIEYQPKILESIKDVLSIVGQHYEHSKASVDTLQEKITERPMSSPADEQPLLTEAPATEKYDDTPVHEKLDRLVDQMQASGKSFARLDILDKIQAQILQTAAEVSDFVSAQKQRIANDHEDKEKAVEAATIALEKRLAQKETVEVEVAGLRTEEEQLQESVRVMKAEQQDLVHQKMRLSADVSSLETALSIRREELHAMEARAEGLERRILEGVIDHSRAFLINKAPNKGRDAMNLKRVPSHATSITGSIMSSSTSKTRGSNTTQSAIGMAMGGIRAAPSNVPINIPAGTSRRNFSLNQITSNVPTGGFKRSHSVKTPGGSGALRKNSWGGSLNRKFAELNKENLALKESEEHDSDNTSDAGTMRRMSRGIELTGAPIDEQTEWNEAEDSEQQVENGHVVLYEDAEQVT